MVVVVSPLGSMTNRGKVVKFTVLDISSPMLSGPSAQEHVFMDMLSHFNYILLARSYPLSLPKPV